MKYYIYAFLFLVILKIVTSTTCKDDSICPENSTCCQLKTGYGCCPYENATCCSDGIHCCPNGYKCDTTHGRCVSGKNSYLAFFDLSQPTQMKMSLSSVPYMEFFPEIQNMTNCAKDIYPIVKDIYHAYKEYRNGSEEGKENSKNLLVKIGEESINLGMDCYKIVETILVKFEFL